MSLGNFARFDTEQCRWRVENGTDDPVCTADEYGQRRHRGWVNLQCNRDMTERTRLLSVREVATCEFELIVQSPELCGPPPAPPPPPALPPLPAPSKSYCNENSLSGAEVSAQFSASLWTLNFFKVRALNCLRARLI